MDIENALIRNLTYADWLTDLAVETYWTNSYRSWDDRFADACDLLMERAGLEAYEHPFLPHTIVAFPHRTRRKRPAFIALHRGRGCSFYKAFARFSGATFTIEFVEAGNHGVAGASTEVDTRAEAEDTALWY